MTYPTIVAKSFRERNVGKIVSQSKVRTEYCLIINNSHELTVEVTNSRFSRRKKILINGEVVQKFHRTNISDLKHSWTYPVGDTTVVFSTCPNKTASGADLKINGKDFFEYVYDVESDRPVGGSKASSETFFLFRVPEMGVIASSPLEKKRSQMYENASIPYQSSTLTHNNRPVDTSQEYLSLDESDVSSD
jgi:hypothetical protein